jgi:hypothetical protein
MNKKEMSVICIILFVLIILNSCQKSNTKNNTPNEDTQNGEQVNSDISGNPNEFVIKSGIVSEVTLAPAADKNDRGDKILAHYKNIENSLNCKISVLAITPDSMEKDIMAANATITKYADLVETNANMIYSLYKGGFLSALQDFSEIDPTSEKWGYQGGKDFMTFEPNKTYGFRGIYTAAFVPTVSNVLFYNKKIY